ncbi:MAG: PRC-barrel domain-containing protein [Solirubrobacteraceae bacterium]
MLNVERIEEWRGQDVLDSAGEKIGKVDEVYYEATEGEAMLLSVKSGLLGRHTALVPLTDASVGRDYIRVAFTREQVEQAERGPDGEVSRKEVQDVSAAFGLELSEGLEVESASLINERRAQAQEARERAEELEAQARQKDEEHAAAEQQAQDATATARVAEEDKDEARSAAEEARAAADRAERPAAEPPR